MSRATRINEFGSGNGYRRPSRAPHRIDDIRYRPQAWVLCHCGVTVEAEDGERLPEAYEAHRRSAGLPPISVSGPVAVAEWAEKQERKSA